MMYKILQNLIRSCLGMSVITAPFKDCRILIKCFSSSWKRHLYGEKHFGCVCFVIAFNISNHLFLHFSKKMFMFGVNFLCFLSLFGPGANTARISNWPCYGWALTYPMEHQLYKSRFAFHVHSSVVSFQKWGPCKPFSARNNKRPVGTRFALLLCKAFDKGILGNAVFQNPVLTS